MPATISDYSSAQLVVIGLQYAFGLSGLALLWRDRANLRARFAGTAPARLAPPPYPLIWLAAGAGFAIGGALIFNIAASWIGARWFARSPTGEIGTLELLVGGATQLGVLAGVAHLWFWHLRAYRSPEGSPRPVYALRAIGAGAASLLAILPSLWIASLLWTSLLKAYDIKPEAQPVIVFFAKNQDPLSIGVMMLVAVALAPITEELVFRAGVFRALRGQIARPLAILLPSVVFAAIHGSFTMFPPLLVLAVGLSLAYEHTGHPLTPITAHALFNLNTLVLVLAGVGTDN